MLKTCPACDFPSFSSDAFCAGCGAPLLAAPAPDAGERVRRRAASPGVTLHRRRRALWVKVIAIVIFWGAVIGVCYALFSYLAKDVPWADVAAVVTGRRRGGAGDPAPTEAGVFDENVSGDALLPPIVPERADVPPAPPPDAKPEWGEPDSNGYSELAAPGGSPGLFFMKAAVRGTRVNLRSEPNTRSSVVGRFAGGHEFVTSRRYWSGQEKFHWYRVESDAGSGWMYGEYLRVTED
jgi:hypothetical protein